jgi:hypothetical protein
VALHSTLLTPVPYQFVRNISTVLLVLEY